jgi:hypothetical protein
MSVKRKEEKGLRKINASSPLFEGEEDFEESRKKN